MDPLKFYIKSKEPINETHVTLEEFLGDTSDIISEEKYITFKGLQLYTVKYFCNEFIGKEKGYVIGVHGGPSYTHNYILPLKLLAKEGYVVLLYDQMGCGKSTFVVDPVNDTPWLLTIEYYVEELKLVIESYDLPFYYLYGSSWGTMLAQEFAVIKNDEITKRLRGLILDGALADSEVYIRTQWRDRLSTLPTFTQNLLKRLTAEEQFSDPRYNCLDENLSKHFICRTIPPVDEYIYSQQLHNPLIYKLMQGESEFTSGGVLKNWSIVDRLNLIEVPTLVMAGEFDTMTIECQSQLVEGIRYAWPLVVIPRTSHCKLLEEPFLCNDVMIKFLNTNERLHNNK